MSMLKQLAARVPAVAALESTLANPSKRSLEAVRGDIWRARSEFWVRRAQNVPVAVRAARTQGAELWSSKLSQPNAWTYGDLAAGVVIGTQLFGCFCIGEILARGSITGYPQGAPAHH